MNTWVKLLFGILCLLCGGEFIAIAVTGFDMVSIELRKIVFGILCVLGMVLAIVKILLTHEEGRR